MVSIVIGRDVGLGCGTGIVFPGNGAGVFARGDAMFFWAHGIMSSIPTRRVFLSDS